MVRAFRILTLLLLPGFAPPAGPDERIHLFLEESKAPGLFVAIVQGQTVRYAKCFGWADREQQIALTDTTCMELGSIGKAFTAEVILALQAENRLHLSDPVARYLPGAPASWNRITLAHLLAHTSGLQNYLLDARFRAADLFTGAGDEAAKTFFRSVTTDSMTRLFYTLPIEFPPGTGWSYSNTGYFLLGKIAERVTDTPFFRLAETRLFVPLHLRRTQANETAAEQGCRATGYFPKDGMLNPAPVLRSNYAFAAGAWATTGQDMIRFLQAMHAGRLPSGPAEALRNPLPGSRFLPFSYWGGRFQTTFHGLQVFSHNGGTPGFSSSWIYVPGKKSSIIVLMNRQDFAAIDALAWDLLSLFEPALQFPRKIRETPEALRYTRKAEALIQAIRTGTPMPPGLSQPLRSFMESANGRGYWQWYFERGYPRAATCVDIEQEGASMIYRFLLPLREKTGYRLALLVNARGEVVQVRWW